MKIKFLYVNQMKSFVAHNRHLHHWGLMMRIYARK